MHYAGHGYPYCHFRCVWYECGLGRNAAGQFAPWIWDHLYDHRSNLRYRIDHHEEEADDVEEADDEEEANDEAEAAVYDRKRQHAIENRSMP